MLHTNFISNGVRYRLVTVGLSHREKEALADNIKPEKMARTTKEHCDAVKADPARRKK
jgi:hypothetical protein